MNVGVVLLVVLDERRNDRTRFLRRGGRVEIDQTFSARRRTGEDRKVGDDALELLIGCGNHDTFARSASRSSSRSASVGKLAIAGSKKPSAIMRSAAALSMPRLSK